MPTVEPRLLTERRELMPTIRSFSELELNANSGNKLRLICLAQCEPVCSLDWYLNEHLLTTSERPDQDANLEYTFQVNNANQTVMSRRLMHELPLDSSSSGIVSVENLIYRPSNSSSKFTWLRETTFGVPTGKQADLIDSESKQLMREADLHLSSANANVFSRFELTYNQINQLLQSARETQADQIELKCKLNAMLAGSSWPSSKSKQFTYAFLEAEHWFPPDKEDTLSVHQFAMSNERHQLNLTALFASKSDDVEVGADKSKSKNNNNNNNGDSSGQIIDANNKSQMRHNWNELHVGHHEQGEAPMLSPGADSFPSSPPDEMQISILLDSEYSL